MSLISAKRNGLDAKVILFSKIENSRLQTALSIDYRAISIIQVITPENIDSFSEIEIENYLTTSDVIFIDRFVPSDISKLKIIAEYINGSKSNLGLVCFGFMEEDLNNDQIGILNPLLPVDISILVNSSLDVSNPSYEVSIRDLGNAIPDDSKIFIESIPWNSFPSVDRRTVVNHKPSANLVAATVPQILSDPSYAMITDWNCLPGAGRVIYYSFEIIEKNIAIPIWPYFNYLIYLSVFHASPNYDDSVIERFSEWPHSPVPHMKDLIGWFSFVGVLWVITIGGLFYSKKISKPWEELEKMDLERSKTQRKVENGKDNLKETTINANINQEGHTNG